ncbi:MAG: hypothetical protein JNK05_24450 [Myxococcales bacterium]|nr:hypothetical protein [Myxococcales bacterium]
MSVGRLSAGARHACAVVGRGEVVCWGDNLDAQLGDGTRISRSTAMSTGIVDAVGVAAGRYVTCAWHADGQVSCWGGDGLDFGPTFRTRPVRVPGLRDVVEVVVRGTYACGRTSRGSVACWGVDVWAKNRGQVATVPGLDDAAGIAISESDGCARRRDGRVACWTYANSRPTTTTLVDSLEGVIAISSGPTQTCALVADGNVRCWRAPQWSPFERANRARGTPTHRASIPGAAAFSVGSDHNTLTLCAVRSDGTVACLGENSRGELGDGTQQDRATPVLVRHLGASTAVAVGSKFVCSRSTDERIACWGSNSEGALGRGSLSAATRPVPVPALSDVVDIASVADPGGTTCAVRRDGALFCWGNNARGQVGDGTTTDRATPTRVSIGLVDDVIGLDDGFAARTRDGAVYVWGGSVPRPSGEREYGPLPTPRRLGVVAPNSTLTAHFDRVCARVEGGPPQCFGELPAAIAQYVADARNYFAVPGRFCVIRADRSLACWGENARGQVGDGTTTRRDAPVAIGGVASVTEVLFSVSSTCALQSDGRVACWGSNAAGELGDRTTRGRLRPGFVVGATDVTQIVVRDRFLALRRDGTVLQWGGVFGRGSAATPVAGLAGVAQLAVRCARLTAGGVACWGDAFAGALGNGDLGYSLQPADVIRQPSQRL